MAKSMACADEPPMKPDIPAFAGERVEVQGTVGGANVSALKPLPEDLEPLVRDASVWRDVAWRGVIVALLALAGFVSQAQRDLTI